MTEKLTPFNLEHYQNANLSKALEKSLEDGLDLPQVISTIKEQYAYQEIIPTILNLISDDLKQRDLLYYLDLLNHFLSRLRGETKQYYINLTKNKVYQKLHSLEKGDYRSILYQFLIDYAPLYQFELQDLKRIFPIDQGMLIKKIVEIAIKKPYLKFFLAYELLLFFNGGDINRHFEQFIAYSEPERFFLYELFHPVLTDPNRKQFFKQLLRAGGTYYPQFIPHFKTFYPEKDLYLKNTFGIDIKSFQPKNNRLRNGFLSRSDLLYFSERDTLVLISDFFEYTRYTCVVEFDTDFNHKKSYIFKQPTLFSKSSYLKDYQFHFPNHIELPYHVAFRIFGTVIQSMTPLEYPPAFLLMNQFFFKGYKAWDPVISGFNDAVGSGGEPSSRLGIFVAIKQLGLDRFLPLEELINPKLLHKGKWEHTKYLASPIFIQNFNDYIDAHKESVLNRLRFSVELATFRELSLDKINFLKEIYYTIETRSDRYLQNLPSLQQYLGYYLAQTSK